MVMKDLAQDLREEGSELYALLSRISPDDWHRPTPFKSWTPQDVMEHLAVGDFLNTLSMTEPERFDEIMQKRATAREAGEKRSGVEYMNAPPGRGGALLENWWTQFNQLCDLFAVADHKARMKWVGPDMSIRSAATARLMETWAHAQDIYDAHKTRRDAKDRIKHIAVLGVNTFGWTFKNRGLEPPGAAPYIELTAPSGAKWTWNDIDPNNRIVGAAIDFCRVVTQGRNIADVSLEVHGEPARQWMAIAQCFAGPPEDPPVPGLRAWAGD